MKTRKVSMTRSPGDRSFQNILAAVGARLAELRVKKGFSTIKDFVEHYNLPEIQYWRIEKGKANITLKSLSRILDIHRVRIYDFFCPMEV